MGLYKILKIAIAVLGLAGVIFLIRIIVAGDDAIMTGESGLFDPMAYVAYIMFGLTLAFVIFFVIKNLFTNKDSLKSTLIGVGLFLAVLFIAYMLSNGSDASHYMYNGIESTEKESHIIGAGIITFYVLILAAIAAMLLSGVKKLIK